MARLQPIRSEGRVVVSVRPLLLALVACAALVGVGGGPASGATPQVARVRLARTSGPPSISTSFQGTGFGPSEALDIAFHGAAIATARPGPPEVSATGQTSGRSAQAPFTVSTDWARFHFDDQNTGDNPFENVLGT